MLSQYVIVATKGNSGSSLKTSNLRLPSGDSAPFPHPRELKARVAAASFGKTFTAKQQ
jgi:hypothetical protein